MSKADMAKPIGVYLRGTTYQGRVVVPQDLQPHYGKSKFVRSLQTKDYAEAKRKHLEWANSLQAEFQYKRKELNPQRLEKITPELAQELADRIRYRVLHNDEQLRSDPALAKALAAIDDAANRKLSQSLQIGKQPEKEKDQRHPLDGLSDREAFVLAGLNAIRLTDAAINVAKNKLSAILPQVQAEALKLGFTIQGNEPGLSEALTLCMHTYRQTMDEVMRRDSGHVVPTPPPPSLTPNPQKVRTPKTFQQVYNRWRDSDTRTDDTLNAAQRVVNLANEFFGEDKDICTLTRSDGDAFKAWLLKKGVASKTTRDRFTWAKTLLKYASETLELFVRHPWEGLKVSSRTEKPRRPWKVEELQKLFSQPLFTDYALPTAPKAGKDAAYWIPLIGCFTGTRVSEVAQLKVDDVTTDKQGQHWITITNEGEGQQVKTSASKRRIPVHSELVRLGFMDYVAHTRTAAQSRLWPNLPLRKNKPGGYFSEWFGHFRRDVELEPDFHAFRHTVRTGLSKAHVSEKVQDHITGHEHQGNTGSRVYQHVDDDDLISAVEKITYTGLVINRVYKK